MGKVDFNIGEFDIRIEFYAPTVSQSNTGAVEKKFISMFFAYAKVSVKNLGETFGEGTILPVEVQEISTYDVPEMDNSWMVKLNDKMYDVLSVDRVQRRFMKIVAKMTV